MKSCQFLLGFILSTAFLIPVQAQPQNKIDSLLQVLKTAKEDTSKVNTLNSLGKKSYLTGNYDQSRKYSIDALQLCEKINYEKGKIPAYLNTGLTHFLQSNYPEALKNYLTALAIAEKIHDKRGIANSYNNMGLVFTYQGNYSEALKKHVTALKIYREIGEIKGLINSYNNMGIIYEEQGNYPEALKSYFACLKIAEEAGDKKATADAYFNIGNVYHKQNNLPDAKENYFAALKLYEETGYKQGIGLCYANLVEYYAKQKDYKKALEFNLKGIEILEAIGDRVRAAEAKDIRGYLYIEVNNYIDALKIFFEDLKLYQEMGDSINTTAAYNNVGQAYYKLKKYDESVKYFNKGLLLAKELGAKENMLNSYRLLAESYEMKNDFKNAYRYHKLYFAMNDSLFNETKSNQITEMKTRYETEKKDDDIALLNKNKEIQSKEINKQKLLKNSFIGGLVLVLVLFFLIYNNYRTRQKLKLENIRNNIAADLHDDIGSTLNSISLFSEVAKQEAGKPIPALDQIGVSARKIIDAMGDIVWTINPENDTFENVIARMRSLAYLLLKAKGIEFIFKADENLNHLSLAMPVRKNFYMLFKEAINNLVKYSNATSASFHISLDNKNVKLVIYDNGVGFDTEHALMGNGIKNMKRRAAEIGAQLLIESAKGKGTNIELSFKT